MSKIFWAVLLVGLLGLAGTIYYSIDAENPQDFELLGRASVAVAVIGALGVLVCSMLKLPEVQSIVSSFPEREDDETEEQEQGLGDRVGWALVWFGGAGLALALIAMFLLGPFPLLVLFAQVAAVAGLAGIACLAVLWVSRASEVEGSLAAVARQNLRDLSISAPQARMAAAGIAVLAIIIGGFWVYDRSKEASVAEAAIVVSTCIGFINKEFNDNSRSNPAFATDTWTKRGSIVVEVGWKETSFSSTYQTRLCVYDPERGKMSSPGFIGRGRWER
ncbi:hypothetical protein [Sulfitobacter mediterraneus]|uniref:hypothetical protein n=1 Tax=Sulfitobacter mediterraneus TaxID=83219 RepID=UPI000EA07741|nr:hypothetical protein [Sulfitobacter mediterraneus]